MADGEKLCTGHQELSSNTPGTAIRKGHENKCLERRHLLLQRTKEAKHQAIYLPNYTSIPALIIAKKQWKQFLYMNTDQRLEMYGVFSFLTKTDIY